MKRSDAVARLGVAAVGLYLAAAAATLTASGHRILPLFEGVGPPPAYQWVHPPAQFSASNVKPQPASSDIAFAAGKSGAAGVSTPDGQFVVNFAAGAFAAHPGDTGVHATVTPLDPATLGPPPAGLPADGNAYRIELAYRPSGVAVDNLALAGDVILTAPNPAQNMLFSPDGRSWSKLPAQPVGGPSTIGSTFNRSGWYLAAAAPTSATGGHRAGIATALIAVGTAVAALALALVVTRHHRRRAPPGRRPPQRRRPQPTSRSRPSRLPSRPKRK